MTRPLSGDGSAVRALPARAPAFARVPGGRLALAACLVAALVSPPALALSREKLADPVTAEGFPSADGWFTVDADKFSLYTNGRGRMAELVTQNMQVLHDLIVNQNPDLQPRFETPTTVMAFKDRRSFAPYQIRRDGRPLQVGGMFIRHPAANYIALATGSFDRDPYPVIYHEYAHYLLKTLFPAIPPWLNEGLAEYYGSMWVFTDRVELGGKLDEHIYVLEFGPLYSLSRLLAVGDRSPEYNEGGSRRGIFYAQAWAFVHFLMQDEPTSLRRFTRFLEEVDKGRSQVDALEEVFGVELSVLERRFRVFVRIGEYDRITLPGLQLNEVPDLHPRAAPPDDVLAHLGALQVFGGVGAPGNAEAQLRAALAYDADDPLALSALAFQHALFGRFEQAEPLYEKVLETSPDDETARFLYGSTLVLRHQRQHILERGISTADDVGEATDDILRARELLRGAIALNPRRAESYLHLGYTYRFDDGDPSEGIAALEKAREFFPRRPEASFYLGVLLTRTDDVDRAVALFEDVRDMDAGVLSRLAEANRITLLLRRAESFLEAGDPEACRHLLRAVRASTDNPRARARIDQALLNMDHDPEVEKMLERAEARAHAGDLNEAEALFSASRERSYNDELNAWIDLELDQIAERRLVLGRLDSAEALIMEGQLSKGASALRAVRRQTGRVELVTRIDDQLVRLSAFDLDDPGQREQLLQLERSMRDVPLFNAARASAREGDVDDARAKLRQVIAYSDKPRLRVKAEKLLGSLEPAVDAFSPVN